MHTGGNVNMLYSTESYSNKGNKSQKDFDLKQSDSACIVTSLSMGHTAHVLVIVLTCLAESPLGTEHKSQ